MEEMQDFIRENDIDIAVLTIPKDGAVATAEKLVEAGIKAIWNFAMLDLDVPDDVQVENVHLSDSLFRLSYMANRYEKQKKARLGMTDRLPAAKSAGQKGRIRAENASGKLSGRFFAR